MALISAAPRSPLEGIVLPAGPRFALAEAPPAARFILRGGESVRVACGIALGAEPPARLGAAGEGAGRAALWLGPDEWLMIADGADPATLGDMLESVLEGTAHSLVDVSHRQVGLIVEGADAARALNAGCPLDLDLKCFPLGFATRTLVRQGGDRALAPGSDDVPRRSLALVRASRGGVARRGRARRA